MNTQKAQAKRRKRKRVSRPKVVGSRVQRKSYARFTMGGARVNPLHRPNPNLAQEIAPEPEVQFIDLNGFYNYEAQANGETIATITHNCGDFVTQPWVVMVGEVEVHRAETWTKCAHYIQWHYKQGTLPKLKTLSPEELLDKPFDQLTYQEWETLKLFEPKLEDVDLLAA